MKLKDYIIIGMFALIIWLSLRTPRSTPPLITTDTITEVRVDTVLILDSVYIPKLTYKFRVDTITKFDTVFILQDYNTKKFYIDSISDLKALIVISDTLFQNKIISRYVQSIVYPVTVYRTVKTPLVLRNEFYAGFGVGGGLNEFGATFNIGLLTKKQTMYTLQYNLVTKTIYGGVFFKIF